MYYCECKQKVKTGEAQNEAIYIHTYSRSNKYKDYRSKQRDYIISSGNVSHESKQVDFIIRINNELLHYHSISLCCLLHYWQQRTCTSQEATVLPVLCCM